MTYTNGDIYNGRWSSDKMDGTGSFTKFDIWRFVGTFQDNSQYPVIKRKRERKR